MIIKQIFLWKTPIELTDNKEIIILFISRIMKALTTSIINKLLTEKSLIGEGATSIVYKVHNLFSNKGYLCLKILKDSFIKMGTDPTTKSKEKKSFWDEEEDINEKPDNKKERKIDFKKFKNLFMEFEILDKLNHPNIVKALGLFIGDSNTNPAILLEYCRTNLEEAIDKLETFELIGIIYEICSAMKHVHLNKIIHRDLKMRNILINSKRHVKVCDFGIAKQIDVTTYTSMEHGIGTLAFMAPELFDEDSIYTEKVDVYSFGVMLYFVVTGGQLPKSNPQNYESYKLPNSINKLSQSIIKRCWSSDPKNRPSFEEIMDLITTNNFKLFDGIESEIPKIKNHLGLK